MAKAGAGKTLALPLDGVSMPMSLTTIALCITSDISAHSGGLNAEGCRQDSKRSGYRCHRSDDASSHGDTVPINRLAPSRFTPPRVSLDSGAFANCAVARATGAAPVRRGGGDVGMMLI